MGVYDRQVANARRIIKAKGQLCNWYPSQQSSSATPTQPWKTADVAPNPDHYQVYIVFTNPKPALEEILAGTSVPAGAPDGLMAAQTAFTPQINDTVDRNGEKLNVKSFDVVQPNGQVILYKLKFS